MDSRLQAVQHPNLVPVFDQQVHRVRTDETCSASDETEIHHVLEPTSRKGLSVNGSSRLSVYQGISMIVARRFVSQEAHSSCGAEMSRPVKPSGFIRREEDG